MATKPPVLSALLHELAKTETWGCYADLAEALKTRAARLHLPYDSAAICAAITHVERVTGRPLVALPGTPTRRVRTNPGHVERVDDARPLSRDEAKDLYGRLLAAVAREHGRRRA